MRLGSLYVELLTWFVGFSHCKQGDVGSSHPALVRDPWSGTNPVFCFVLGWEHN